MSRGQARALAPALLLLAAVWGPVPAPAQEEASQAKPEDLGIEERLRIDYVLIDFIVLDEDDNPVPDVTLEQLRLKVAGEKVAIQTLDRHCAQAPGATQQPQPTEPGAAAPSSAAVPRPRIVLVFDYDHMTKSPEVFDRALDMMAASAAGGEQQMIVSFAEVVRLETPFTTDIDELRWALRRMRNDRDLFAKQRAPLTEQEFFERLRAIFDLLGGYDGRKTVVLFSGPFMSDGFTYDERYHDVAGLAAAARTAIYPVDAAGLRTPDLSIDSRRRRPVDTRAGSVGGPPELSRLATETGGRMTSNTNDIGQAYEQAKRDLACTYTLGFRDPKLQLDRDLNLSLKIEGRGNLRVVYPDRYIVRSEKARRESLVRTAALAPHVFESADVGVDLFVTGAKGGSWKGVIAAELHLPPEAVAAEGESWKLESFLRKPNGTIVHHFTRSVDLPKPEPGRPVVARTFEELEPPAGDYALSVVLADPRGEPRASTRSIHIPEVPQQGPFLIGPILGHGEGSDFSPLVEQAAQAGETLDALTVFCVAGTGGDDLRSSVARRLVDAGERDVHRLAEAPGEIQGGGVRCQKVLDKLDTKSLAPGKYEIRARGEAGPWVTDESGTEFEIEAEPQPSPAPDRR